MLTLVKNNLHQELKPIFFSQIYLESSLAYCDLCTAVVDSEKELYFKCEICNNFIACLDCIKQKTRRLVSHPFDHHFVPSKPASNTHWKKRNLTITCDLCGEKHFFGKRYQCRQCLDYNVCSKCLSKAQHSHYPSEQHIFTYIFNPTRIASNRYLLADRALRVLRYHNAGSTDRDKITGWTIAEAKVICADEINNYQVAWNKASEIFEDDDIDFIPSIIENEKLDLPLVFIENN